MSTQQPLQQQPPPPQPVVLYPNTVSRQAPSSHSNGSFGTVFIVLAVIVVISGIACCLGRICNKRLNKQKVISNDKPSSLRLSQHTPSFGPRERGRDLEIGFDKGFAAARHGNGSDPARGHKPFGKGHFSGHNARGEANTSAGDHQGAPSAGP